MRRGYETAISHAFELEGKYCRHRYSELNLHI